jgi:Response regulator receiver domain
VVLIVEDEALVRMTAVDMIEEAGFEVLEATNADEAILLLEARRDITVVFTDIEMPGSMDGLRLAQPSGADGRPSKLSRHRAVTSCGTAICRPAGCSWQNRTAPTRFPAPYGISRPRPRTWPWPTPPSRQSSCCEKNSQAS